MIDFNTYECVKLEDVAEFSRAKQGHVYPRGASTLQISATKGQIGYLNYPKYVHTKEVVIIPQAGIDTAYFNIILQKNVEAFMQKYATGINIQEHEVGNFPIQLHNLETQKVIAKMMKYLDDKESEIEAEISTLMKMKSNMLSTMLV